MLKDEQEHKKALFEEPQNLKKRDQRENQSALILQFISIGFLTAGFTFNKYGLSNGILVGDFIIVRSLISLAIIFPLMLINKQGLFTGVPESEMGKLFVRSLIGAGAMFFYNFSFIYMPISHITVIYNIYPILASIFAYFLNGEKVLRSEIYGLIACFFGILFFAYSKMQKEDNLEENKNYLIGLISILITAVLFGLTIPLVRQMREVHYTVIVLWVNIVTLAIYFCIAIFTFDAAAREEYQMLPFLAVCFASFFLVIKHIFGTLAQQRGKSSLIAMVSYAQVPFSILIDVVVFKQSFDVYTLFAISIILSTTLIVAYQKLKI